MTRKKIINGKVMYTDDAFNYLMFLLSGGRPMKKDTLHKIKPKRKNDKTNTKEN
tara:strand:- start:182 stop:343 length:162 start_codon:yes stop_codon:yes gene_type:complete